MSEPSVEIPLGGIHVELQVTHKGLNGVRTDCVYYNSLLDISLFEFHFLYFLLLPQLTFELLEFLLGKVLLLFHSQIWFLDCLPARGQVQGIASQPKVLSLLEPLLEELFFLLHLGLIQIVLLKFFLLLPFFGQCLAQLICLAWLLVLFFDSVPGNVWLFRKLSLFVFLFPLELLPKQVHFFPFLFILDVVLADDPVFLLEFLISFFDVFFQFLFEEILIASTELLLRSNRNSANCFFERIVIDHS